MSTDALFFPADKALEAMGNTSRRWQNHLETNKIHVPPQVSIVSSFGPGRGKHRHISIAAIVQGAIAFALIDCGVDVVTAYRVGAEFAYQGAGVDVLEGGEAEPLDPVLQREPGRLYTEGETFLIYAVEVAEPSMGRLAFISGKNPAFASPKGVSAPDAVVNAVEGEDYSPRIVLNLSQLCRRIAAALGISFTAAFVTGAA